MPPSTGCGAPVLTGFMLAVPFTIVCLFVNIEVRWRLSVEVAPWAINQPRRQPRVDFELLNPKPRARRGFGLKVNNRNSLLYGLTQYPNSNGAPAPALGVQVTVPAAPAITVPSAGISPSIVAPNS